MLAKIQGTIKTAQAMTYKHNIIKERFDLQITAAGQTARGEFELDKNARFLMGILLTSDQDALVYFRGTQKIQFNDQELFPEGFESRLLMAGLNVSPGKRMVKVGDIASGNGRLDIWYTDTEHADAKFVPYRVTFYAFSRVNLEETP